MIKTLGASLIILFLVTIFPHGVFAGTTEKSTIQTVKKTNTKTTSRTQKVSTTNKSLTPIQTIIKSIKSPEMICPYPWRVFEMEISRRNDLKALALVRLEMQNNGTYRPQVAYTATVVPGAMLYYKGNTFSKIDPSDALTGLDSSYNISYEGHTIYLSQCIIPASQKNTLNFLSKFVTK